MAQRKTLTERQVEVLRRIGDGCPEGVMTDAGHFERISAGALRNRGLVTTSGSRKTWSATITEAGKEYLARVDGPNPPIPREPNRPAAQQLVDDLIAAGGSLTFPRRQGQSSWGDAKRQTLEECLPAILMEVEIRAAEERERLEIERNEAERRRQAWEDAMARAKERHTEHHRSGVLDGQVAAWQHANAIRSYCDAIEQNRPADADVLGGLGPSPRGRHRSSRDNTDDSGTTGRPLSRRPPTLPRRMERLRTRSAGAAVALTRAPSRTAERPELHGSAGAYPGVKVGWYTRTRPHSRDASPT